MEYKESKVKMNKRLCLIPFFVLIICVFCGCSGGIKLFSASTLVSFIINDEERAVLYDESDTLSEFKTRFGGIEIYSDVLDEQDNGNAKIGETYLTITVNGSGNRTYQFEVSAYKNIETGETEYYFQRQVRGLYYLSKRISQDNLDYLNKIFYGDIIIID